VASTSRALFDVDRTGGKSFTRKLTERGMGKMYQDAPFAVFDTMGLERESMTKVINHDLVWLVDGRVRTTCEMKWLGRAGRSWDGGCYQPWNEPPEQRRALHALLFVTRFFPTDSEDFSLIKHFIQDLRRMLHEKQRELVVAVTHLEGCDKTLTAEACRREYERLLGIGLGNVVVLSATHRVPPYAMKAWPGLDGSIVDEQSATDGVYLEPDALVQLTTTLQTACCKAYEQQLNFNDEAAALAASESSTRWIFNYYIAKYIVLAIVDWCCWHWRHTSPGRFATIYLVVEVIVNGCMNYSLGSASVVLFLIVIIQFWGAAAVLHLLRSFLRICWSWVREHCWSQRDLQQCCICYDVFPVSAGLRCESIAGHFICADCAPREVQRILEAIQEAEPLARHRAQGGYIVCVQQDCGAQYAEPALARVLPDALCRRYRAAQNAVVEQRLFEELQQGFQEQIEAERREFENANNVVRQGAAATAEFLRRQYPNAVQCPRCHAGPVIPENCYNLQTHHGESSSSGRGRISNACPGCGFFSRERGDWVRWDGHMRGAL